jgi:hypothetical protein
VAGEERSTGGMSLREAARIFWSEPSPWCIAPCLLAAVVAWALVGHLGWWDLLVPAIVLAAQPFTEWTIHVFLLHFKPRRVAGLRVDPLVSRKHREHHADPRDVHLIFIPMPTLVALLVGIPAVLVLPLWAAQGTVGLARGLSGAAAAYAMAFTYEWTHYLIHSAYRPRHRVYRYIWRAHRNHHFRNEHYWFGVTMHLADHVLGTFPERSAVEVSPTARTLGVDAA